MRLIDADNVIDNINEWLDTVGYAVIGKGLSYYAELIGCIDESPTIEAEPIRHGHWIWDKCADMGGVPKCSVCGRRSHSGAYNYCPRCGAKMEDNKMKKYLILTYDTRPYETDAVDIFEAIENFAKYCGDDSELFLAALNGARTVEEGIRMFNHFCTYTITDVYGVSRHCKCHYNEPFEEYNE